MGANGGFLFVGTAGRSLVGIFVVGVELGLCNGGGCR